MRLAGLIALSDPPRADSADLIAQLRTLGVRTIIVTGDAPVTAGIVAHAVGLDGAVCPSGAIPGGLRPDSFSVFAGVLPEDKYHLVQEFQKTGHTVGMCGDGANDAPALRQAQMGIAVSTATDVAKSAAGLVLTEPGLGGIVESAAVGKYRLGFDLRELQTLSIVTLIFSGQAILYTVRERRHLWSSRPSTWLMAASVADLLVIGTLATRGIFMKPLPVAVVAILLGLTVVFCLLLDLIKVRVFRRLQIV
jgi:high-affinity K+ transport system ATPase subunit B